MLTKNCEHFANMIGLGINYSYQDNKGKILGTSDFFQGLLAVPSLGISLLGNRPTLNNGKGSTIKLTNEINETDNKLGLKTNDRSEEIGRRYLQEVPPKEPCRIM